MKNTLLHSLLTEIEVNIDAEDPEALQSARRDLVNAKRNPSKTALSNIQKSKEELKTASSAENSPTKVLDVQIAKTKQHLAQLQRRRMDIKKRTKTTESVDIPESLCEVVYVDENDEIVHEGLLTETAIRAFKRQGTQIKQQYRCTSGAKDGKIVANASDCSKRKDPKKVKQGKISAKKKRGVRIQKTRIAKNKPVSKMVQKMNARLNK